MKIAYILTTFPCRSESFAQREIEQLKKNGVEITVFAARSDGLSCGPEETVYRPALCSLQTFLGFFHLLMRYPPALLKIVIRILKTAGSSPAESLSLIKNLHTIAFFTRELDRRSINHIHAYFLSWPACMAAAIADISGRSFSIAAHARDIFVEAGALELKASTAKFITVCTQDGLDHLKEKLPSKLHRKLFLNYHGIPLKGTGDVESDEDIKRYPNLILAAGRFTAKKGFDLLLRAFAEVRRVSPDCKLILAGDGYDCTRLKAIAIGLGLNESVRFLGWQSNDIIKCLLQSAGILAVPSVIAEDGDRDGVPNIILEAFCEGTAVVCGNQAGPREAVDDMENGMVVDAADIEKFSGAILTLLRDGGLRERFRRNGFKTLTEKFDLNKNVSQLIALFEQSNSNKEKIKIAHIVEGLTGGLATYCVNVLAGQVKAGFDVTLICSLERESSDGAAAVSTLKEAGVRVYIVPMRRQISPLSDMKCLAKIAGILFRNRFEIVHTHGSKGGALGRIAAFLSGAKVIFHTPHCLAFVRCKSRIGGFIYLNIERLLGRITTKIIAVSESEAQTAVNRKIIAADRCEVVNNGLGNHQPEITGEKLNFLRGFIGIKKNALVVSTCCRLVDYKGVLRFLEAAERCRTANAVFLIAGEGPLRAELEESIRQRNLEERVKLLGYVENIRHIYDISDVIVLCSDCEGQPYTLLEAMLKKRAIVATNVGGNRDTIIHNQTGILTKVLSSSIAYAVDNLLADKAKRAELGENSYRYFCENYLLGRQIEELSQIYADAI